MEKKNKLKIKKLKKQIIYVNYIYFFYYESILIIIFLYKTWDMIHQKKIYNKKHPDC